MENMKFILVGHIDHGKSTLIGRLLYDTNSLPPDKMTEVEKISKDLGRETEFSFLMDHLQEEREQGITIDTSQIFFSTSKRDYLIIDAPGHVEFVKNMITGASQAEAGVLIIDALEGIQQQTKRHSYILNMLGLKQIIVVINKMDLVKYSEDEYESIKSQAKQLFDTLKLSPRDYLPISALQGDNIVNKSENMQWYEGMTFLEALDSLTVPAAEEMQPLLLPIQDVYKIEDKRILVGRIESGAVKKGERVKILPEGQTTTIKSIEKYLEDEPTIARVGESIGITLSDPVFTDRGNIVCDQNEEPELTDTIDANIFWLSKKECHVNEQLSIRIATQEVHCRIVRIRRRIDSSNFEFLEDDADTLGNLEVGETTIKTNKLVAISSFNNVAELGRFVLMRGDDVCAGGIISGG